MKARRSFLILSGLFLAAMLFAAVLQAGAQSKTVNSKLRLEYLMTFHADFVQPVDIGQVAAGRRQIFMISGGNFDGPRLRGQIFSGPVDWFLTAPDGIGRMDIRATFQTDDGANIYMRYQGVQVMTAAAGAKIPKGEVIDYGEIYWLATPVFETGDTRYAWLNNIIAVSEARLGPNASWIEYRVFQVMD
jgi:Protein of unknown function (DUF3237)